MEEREKMMNTLQQLAGIVDTLQETISKAQEEKQAIRCDSDALLIGNDAMLKISAATGCPVIPLKDDDGFYVSVGGERSEEAGESQDLWGTIQKEVEAVAEVEKLIKEDRKCRNTITSNMASLKKMITTKEQSYRKKYEVMSHATIAEIIGYRLANTFSADKNIQQSELFKSGFKNLSAVTDSLSFNVLAKALLPDNGGLDSSFTVSTLMGKLVDVTECDLGKLADRLRASAECIQQELDTPRAFLEDCL